MKQITIFTDRHSNGPNPCDGTDLEFGPNVVHLGDNWEQKNIPYSDVSRSVLSFQEYVEKCKATGTIVVGSNHDMCMRKLLPDYAYDPEYKVLYIHGDEIFSLKYFLEWRLKKGGASKKKIALIKYKNRLTSFFKHEKNDLSDKDKELIYKFIIDFQRMKNVEVKHICMGHQHPLNTIDIMFSGKRITICQRDMSLITLLEPTVIQRELITEILRGLI